MERCREQYHRNHYVRRTFIEPAQAIRTYRSYKIPFPVLSDPDLVLHKAFNVLQLVDEQMVKKYKAYGIDLEKSSGRKHHTIAVPSLFVIDRAGFVRWAHADRDHRTRPSTEQILQTLGRLKAVITPAP